jgi:autotransporter-associated beta strand protein
LRHSVASLAKAGPATLTINGMTMAEGDFYLLGGTTAHTGGTTTIKAPIVGSGTGYSAIFAMSGGTLSVTGTCVLPGDSGCARMSVGDFGGTGVVNHTGGTIKVAGTVGVSPASFAVGNQGGDGTYNISGGVLQFGDAADPVNSGIWGVGRSTASATDATTNGTLNISGTGLVDVQTGDLVNGDRDAAIRAGGETTVSTITMTGGELRIGANAEFFLAGFNNNAAVDSTFNLNGGQLTVGGASLQEFYAGGTGAYQFNFGNGTIMVSGSALTTTADATLTGATAGTGATINTNGLGANWNGVLSGSGWLVKAGAGTLNLGGANTYTGGTAFNGGTVFADAVADLGALSAGMSFNGGTLQLGVADLLTTRTGAMALAGAGTIDTNGFNTGYAGAISGTGGLTKAGTGTLTLSGANTYSGATTISAGTLATSGGSAIGDASAVTVASGATLSLGGNETVGSLAGAGSVALAANTLTAGGNNGSTSFTGTTAGSGGFTKAGTGTMSTGNLAHTGLTTVNGGTLNVNGSVAGSVVVNSGGTLSGNTAIAGNLTLNAGGALSSGNSPGTTTVAGNFVGGGLLNVEVQFNNAGAPVNGTTHDFLNITGNVTGVSTLNILAVAPSTAPTITTGNGIELVRVGGTTSAGAFVLSGPVVQGGIQYLLNYLPNYSGTLDGYFLQATARDEIAGHVAILSAGRSMLARCNRGDERFSGPIGAGGKRAWAKFLGGSVETGADTGLQTDQEFSCTAGGMDLASAGDLRLGLAGGFGDTSVDVTTVAGVSKIDGDQSTIEAQASYAMGSTFVNMTAGYASTDWTHTGPVSGVTLATVDGLIGSVQVGQRWSLGEAWQLGLSGGLDYDGTSCTKSCLLAGVTADESNWRGNVAAKLSGTSGKFRPFASISYSDDLDGGNAVSLGGVSVAADTASSLLTARAGFDARLNEKVGLFIDAGMVEGLDNDVTGYDGQAGLRINW